MELTPDTLQAFLMVLADARVRRARLEGIGEFEWDPEPAPAPAEMPTGDAHFEYQPPAPTSVSAPSGPVVEHPGYASLFGNRLPGFKKATEPQG
jgi:hypothetical protein